MISEELKDQVALVTGASRGIGRDTALALAGMGAHLVLTARSQGGLEETDDLIRASGGSATLLPLDMMREAEQLDMLGPSIVERFGRLDVLVHAAGVLSKLTPAAHIMPRDWEESLAVNVSATWRLIRTCDPALRAAPAGRAVVLTDSYADRPTAYFGLYSAAKAAQAHLVRCWAAELEQTPVRVALADPGPVASHLRRAAFPGEDQAKLRQPAEAGAAIAALVAGSPERGATIRL
ncbi:SDR family oxidoreductase [Roseococcus sp. SYP-B2431]|uniref:SDR family NAD(P)-dependent oxidoreductase n=1 Tax=Roseococcus sp. SYP-B2431 TaxID=2496640 RepID=UPI0010398E1E|nr:SDR family oxidoreductase [Roseococcus sp. SYP-B2431]TCH98710.1 SDR family oxidoreductase [Roseococcus sp. SYP-B2431]